MNIKLIITVSFSILYGLFEIFMSNYFPTAIRYL
jgi:hypothetical protein